MESLIKKQELDLIELEDKLSQIQKVTLRLSPPSDSDDYWIGDCRIGLDFIIPNHLIAVLPTNYKLSLKDSPLGEKLLTSDVYFYQTDLLYYPIEKPLHYLVDKGFITEDFEQKIRTEYTTFLAKHNQFTVADETRAQKKRQEIKEEAKEKLKKLREESDSSFNKLLKQVAIESVRESTKESLNPIKFSSLWTNNPEDKKHLEELKPLMRAFNQTLNGTQQSIIKEIIRFPLKDVLILEPRNAVKALKAMISVEKPLSDEEISFFTDKKVLDSIETVRRILNHPCPQNRAEGICPSPDPNKVIYMGADGNLKEEQKGLLSLTARSDNTAPSVTKSSVVDYINGLVERKINKQVQKILNNMEIAPQLRLNL